jgi:hypothetical protein
MSENGKFQIEITRAEMVVLVKFHLSQAKRIPKRMGDLMMKERGKLLPSSKTMNAIATEARSLMDFHTSRAKGLASILHEKGGAA